MNRKQRRAAEARARKAGNAPTTKLPTWSGPVPDDIKRDIAKVVRSVEFQFVDDVGIDKSVEQEGAFIGGMCLFRNLAGQVMLWKLEIAAKIALGGMIYRTGPDERRDVVAFCGENNTGVKTALGLGGHYFLISGDNIVDFSVGDWKADSAHAPEHEHLMGLAPTEPAHWEIEPPDFFWAERSAFTPRDGTFTPELGRAWYTGWSGEPPDFDRLFDDFEPTLKSVTKHLNHGIKFYALKERLFAMRNGHTAMRFSELAKLIGDPRLIAKAKQQERLIVLRGKRDITPDDARALIAEAGLDREAGHC
jgi:hypothetical protein